MWQKENPHKSSFKDSVKTLESHIQHANNLFIATAHMYATLMAIRCILCQLKSRQLHIMHAQSVFCNAVSAELELTFIVPCLYGMKYFCKSCYSRYPYADLYRGYRAFALKHDYGGDSLYMKLHYGSFAPLLLFLIEWMDYSCTDSVISYLGLLQILVYQVYVDGVPTESSRNRIATLREFYAIIYPSLKQLEGDMILLKENKNDTQSVEVSVDEKRKLSGKDPWGDEECGICMEACTDAVLPNCGHSMCITCFQDWNARSQSCPFCRGNLKKVGSGDLWFLMNKNDVLDMVTLAKENIRHFYLYIENLPLMVPDTHLLLYEYLI